VDSDQVSTQERNPDEVTASMRPAHVYASMSEQQHTELTGKETPDHGGVGQHGLPGR
jgi:hypothetical protein